MPGPVPPPPLQLADVCHPCRWPGQPASGLQRALRPGRSEGLEWCDAAAVPPRTHPCRCAHAAVPTPAAEPVQVEGITLDEDSLSFLGEIGEETSLRHAVQVRLGRGAAGRRGRPGKQRLGRGMAGRRGRAG
jgi:hypothetical protein